MEPGDSGVTREFYLAACLRLGVVLKIIIRISSNNFRGCLEGLEVR